MAEYEYKLVGTLIVFYYLVFFILGLLGQGAAADLGYERVNVYTGFKAMIVGSNTDTGDTPDDFNNNPFSDGVASTLFYVFMLLPVATVMVMMGLNWARGR